MADIKKIKVLMDNVHFYKKNISILLKLRPNNKVFLKYNGGIAIQCNFSGLDKNKLEDIELLMDILPALNSSLILNCFALFEASFGNKLLLELNTSNLIGIQEKVMVKYIDDIIKLSSLGRYEKEFKFISGTLLNRFFNESEMESYKMIKVFYELRNLLIHGSVTKSVMANGGRIEMDLDNTRYQEIITIVKDKLNIEIPKKYFTLDLLLINNEVTDLLIGWVFTVSNKLLEGTNTVLKFLDQNKLKNK